MHAIELDRLPISHGTDGSIGTKAGAQHWQAIDTCQIRGTTTSGVVGMAMSDDGTRYRAPRVDEKIARFAVQSFCGDAQQLGHVSFICRRRLS